MCQCQHNGNVVSAGVATTFHYLTNVMLKAANMQAFECAVTVRNARKRFPKCKIWFNWWTQPGTKPARRNHELEEEMQALYNMPCTNNAVESINRNTDRFLSYKKMHFVIAAHAVFKFCLHELRRIQGIRLSHVVLGRVTRAAASSSSRERRRRPRGISADIVTQFVHMYHAGLIAVPGSNRTGTCNARPVD